MAFLNSKQLEVCSLFFIALRYTISKLIKSCLVFMSRFYENHLSKDFSGTKRHQSDVISPLNKLL